MFSLGNPVKRKVSGCNLHFLRIAQYGKKSILLGLKKGPQDVVNRLTSLQACLTQGVQKAFGILRVFVRFCIFPRF